MKILVRGTNWIGDSVMTIPALRALRSVFVDDQITLLSPAGTADVFIDAGFIDHVKTFDTNSAFMTGNLRDARMLRQEEFDLAILFTNSFGTAFTLASAGISKRIGYAKEGRSPLLTTAVPIPEWRSDRHEVYYYLNLVTEAALSEGRSYEMPETALPIEIEISAERTDAARAMLGELGVELSKPTVALGIGSTNSRAKRWLPERFVELANRLVTGTGANILLVGSAGDADVADRVHAGLTATALDLCGKTTVGEIAAILSVCDAMVSNDMGLAHLAPAVGTPTTVIFGPTNAVTTRPFSKKVEIIDQHVDCAPCMLRDCPIDHRCMTRIDVAEVLESVESQLSDNGDRT